MVRATGQSDAAWFMPWRDLVEASVSGTAGGPSSAPSPQPDPSAPAPPTGPGPVRRWGRRVVTFFVGTEHRIAAWSFVIGALTVLVAIAALLWDVLGPDDGGSSAQPAAGSPSATPSPSEPDLYVTSQSVPVDTGCMALPDAPTSLADRAELAADSDPFGLAKRHGGVMVGSLAIDITLQGGQRALTVESIDVVPRTPRPARPLDGALLCLAGQADVNKVGLAANMDAPAPYLYEEDSPARPHFRDHVITLASQEQVTVQALFQAKQGYREFEIVVRYTLNGKRKSLTISPPSGGAYMVTAPSGTYDLGYLYSTTGTRRMNAREMCDASGARESC